MIGQDDARLPPAIADRFIQPFAGFLKIKAFGYDLNLLTPLHGVLVNFGVQTARVDPDYEGRYLIEVSDDERYLPGPNARLIDRPTN